MHFAVTIPPRHLLVDDSTSGRHPLDVTGRQYPLVSQTVAMLHFAGENVGNGFNSPMRMPGKTCQVVLRFVVSKVVQQQERVEILGVAEPEGSTQVHARTLNGGFGFDQSFDGSYGHGFLMTFCGCGRNLLPCRCRCQLSMVVGLVMDSSTPQSGYIRESLPFPTPSVIC